MSDENTSKNTYENGYMIWFFPALYFLFGIGTIPFSIAVIVNWEIDFVYFFLFFGVTLGNYVVIDNIVGYFSDTRKITLREDSVMFSDAFNRTYELRYSEVQEISSSVILSRILVRIIAYDGRSYRVGYGYHDVGQMLENILLKTDNIKRLEIKKALKTGYWKKVPDMEIVNEAIGKAEENSKTDGVE